MTACNDDAMPRRSGCRSSTSSVTTGTISAQPKANTASGHTAQATCAWKKMLATTLTTEVTIMIRKPSRICRLGATLPAMRPLARAPSMMPPMVSRKNQKNCCGCSAR
ncbi:hypothetical protein D9M69_685910 [compost metagenome]